MYHIDTVYHRLLPRTGRLEQTGDRRPCVRALGARRRRAHSTCLNRTRLTFCRFVERPGKAPQGPPCGCAPAPPVPPARPSIIIAHLWGRLLALHQLHPFPRPVPDRAPDSRHTLMDVSFDCICLMSAHVPPTRPPRFLRAHARLHALAHAPIRILLDDPTHEPSMSLYVIRNSMYTTYLSRMVG